MDLPMLNTDFVGQNTHSNTDCDAQTNVNWVYTASCGFGLKNKTKIVIYNKLIFFVLRGIIRTILCERF